MDVKDKIIQLRKALHEHNYLYYILDAPKISDFEFDQMLSSLQELEHQYPEFSDPNSPTQRVGGAVTKNFRTQGRPRMSARAFFGTRFSKHTCTDPATKTISTRQVQRPRNFSML